MDEQSRKVCSNAVKAGFLLRTTFGNLPQLLQGIDDEVVTPIILGSRDLTPHIITLLEDLGIPMNTIISVPLFYNRPEIAALFSDTCPPNSMMRFEVTRTGEVCLLVLKFPIDESP